MVKVIIISLIIFCCVPCHAQDTIYFRTSEKTTVILTEINPDNLKFRRFDNQNGPVYTVLKNEVSQIVFSNGKREVFKEAPASQAVSSLHTMPAAVTTGADTIFFRNGKRSAVKIKEISTAEIRYLMANYLDGPTFTISKEEVNQVVFSSGMKESFASYTAPRGDKPVMDQASLASKARLDARNNYRHNGGSIGVGIATGIFPPLGLIPAIACSAVPPRERNMGYTDDQLWKNPTYKVAYTKEAFKKKKRKIWKTFGIVTGCWLGLVILSSV